MPRTKDESIDRLAEEAAFLSDQGHPQTRIAALMKTTQPTVSKLLRRAKGLGCYVTEVRHRFIDTKVKPERLAELRGPRTQGLIDALQRVESDTGVTVRDVRVIDDVGSDTEAAAFKAAVARFGRASAPRVRELCGRSRTVGVTWGSTMRAIVEALTDLGRPVLASPPMFFPVCAESEENAGSRDSSSVLAARLNTLFGVDDGGRLSLTRIPAFIPSRFTGPRRSGIEEMMFRSKSYGRIFGTRDHKGLRQPGLIDDADMLLTSVGHAEHPLGFNYDELLESTASTKRQKMTPAQLEKLVVGDIGGILIRRPGLSRSDKNRVDQLNAMWTGLKCEALEQLAVRASKAGAEQPGVVVVSCGATRDEILHAILARGLVNELVLDQQAATALRRLLGA